MAETLKKLVTVCGGKRPDVSIIHLYKRYGNPQVCDNHIVISVLLIAGKILTIFC